jgi:cytochrome oxidase assembly protein ShyY1
VGSLRFLLSRRWILFFLVVVLLAYATWWLGEWQFHRLAHRKADNATITHNLVRPADDVADVMAVGRPVADDDQWRHLSATGTYDAANTVIIRYQTRDGAAGVEVVVPLVTAAGTAVLVDRGWLETDNAGSGDVEPPAPPTGQVTVGGYLRQDGTGRSTEVTNGSARAISSVEIGKTLPYPVYRGFLALSAEIPATDQQVTSLALPEGPELGNGPHFFYGLQWWFFGLLAIFGFCYLAYDEWRGGPAQRQTQRQTERQTQRQTERQSQGQARRRPGRQTARSMPPSTGSITPETNEAAGDSRKAATRPNSSGSP